LLSGSAPDGKVIGIDRDPDAIAVARERLGAEDPARWTLLHGSFAGLGDLLREAGVDRCDGILADLGLSSLQLDDPLRGFSFRFDGPLDMRMDRTAPTTAVDVIRSSTRPELEHILREYGEERRAAKIAREVHEGVRARRIRDTADLARAIRWAAGSKRSGGVDAATRTFQALRIAVNTELDQLSSLLERFIDNLAPCGVFVCISYHSLEDRLVKRSFKALEAQGRGVVLTRKPLSATRDEIRQNRRARSAKLRAFRKNGEDE
jgi:16S rRNA (cytosine1402-N4)-methyltransferase